MPLSKLQSHILRLLAAHRDPESYVAGSTPLNWNAPRFSEDINFFHDREERVARAVEEDSAVLQEQGFTLQWLRRELNFHAVLVKQGDDATKLEWERPETGQNAGARKKLTEVPNFGTLGIQGGWR